MRASSSFLISVNLCSVSKTWFFKPRKLSSVSQPFYSACFLRSLASFRWFCLSSISFCNCLLLTVMWSVYAYSSRPRCAYISMALFISLTSSYLWVIRSYISSVFSHISCTAPRCMSTFLYCSLSFMFMPSKIMFVVSPLSTACSYFLTYHF